MKAYAAAGDLEAISIYLDELDTDLNTVDTVVKTGNSMAGAILNSKISLAQSKDIQVMVDASIPVKLRMSEIDLCCIIGNLFDNAIEASLAKELDESFFRVGRGMILNLKHISRVTKKEVLLFDGPRLPLPRGAYEALNRAIIERG
ncbi:MAG: LytTR family transcriptional regulator DNA-binding domain-containing protein [Clostridiales bacterium]|nr:LytTR family transcriptional regulator DNA-binding domain-containing protein [Clostridiales bacterium]